MARTSAASAALMLFFSYLRCHQCGRSVATNVTNAPARKPRKVQSCWECNASDTRLSMFMCVWAKREAEPIRCGQPLTSAESCQVRQSTSTKSGECACLRLRDSGRAPQRPKAAQRAPCWASPSLKLSVDKNVAGTLQRCGHPGQQHGLRMPPRSLSMPTSMRRCLVSSFLADVTQQIHSLRASGGISVQRLFAAALDSMAFRISAGSLCTVPPAIL